MNSLSHLAVDALLSGSNEPSAVENLESLTITSLAAFSLVESSLSRQYVSSKRLPVFIGACTRVIIYQGCNYNELEGRSSPQARAADSAEPSSTFIRCLLINTSEHLTGVFQTYSSIFMSAFAFKNILCVDAYPNYAWFANSFLRAVKSDL